MNRLLKHCSMVLEDDNMNKSVGYNNSNVTVGEIKKAFEKILKLYNDILRENSNIKMLNEEEELEQYKTIVNLLEKYLYFIENIEAFLTSSGARKYARNCKQLDTDLWLPNLKWSAELLKMCIDDPPELKISNITDIELLRNITLESMISNCKKLEEHVRLLYEILTIFLPKEFQRTNVFYNFKKELNEFKDTVTKMSQNVTFYMAENEFIINTLMTEIIAKVREENYFLKTKKQKMSNE